MWYCTISKKEWKNYKKKNPSYRNVVDGVAKFHCQNRVYYTIYFCDNITKIPKEMLDKCVKM